MISREKIEENEMKFLSEFAAKSKNAERRFFAEKCILRTEFQRDKDKIIHSKSFRRLKHKTQVFLSPEKDHFRTRLTHTLEVSQIARTIARALGLNEDLAEAIALGHDLGHTPFGHSGEKYLDKRHKSGFRHNEQSLKVVDILEEGHDGFGMNLTNEVRDGILNHTGPVDPMTLEGQIVKLSDRIAYINHDIDDSIRAGIIQNEDLPKDCLDILGYTHSDRINNLVLDVVKNSMDKPKIHMSQDMLFYKNKLRTYMFENVYYSKVVKKDEEMKKIKHIIYELYEYFLKTPDQLPIELIRKNEEYDREESVKDYIAGMTDNFAINIYKEIFIPIMWK